MDEEQNRRNLEHASHEAKHKIERIENTKRAQLLADEEQERRKEMNWNNVLY